MEKVKKVADTHRAAVEYAHRGGLEILAGTDAVLHGMHGRNYLELTHLMRDGLGPLSAWHSATGLAAKHIGQHDAGTLVAGQRADLLVCRGDVLDRPDLLGDGALIEVMQDGLGHRGGLAGVPQRDFMTTVRTALDA